MHSTYFEQIPLLPVIDTIHLPSTLIEVFVVLHIAIEQQSPWTIVNDSLRQNVNFDYLSDCHHPP